MNDALTKWRADYEEYMKLFDDDPAFQSLCAVLRSNLNTFAMNRKLMQKALDASWVEVIENGLTHVDNVLRHPRRTIEDVEEIVPIALSKKITVESVKHLAQHTDLIQSVDRRTGKITPSKVLNVHKEESLMTYENKFVNTLIERLYIFVMMRYEKLVQVAKDEEVYSLGFRTEVDDTAGGRLKLEMKLETAKNLEEQGHGGFTMWQRVEKLKKAIEGYKGSELCKALGNTFIRPPVMRTNAIMKNVDLKACLTLWQYIEGYDKVGYEINIEDSAVEPSDTFIEDFYRMTCLQMLLFRTSVGEGPLPKVLDTQKLQRVAPVVETRFSDELSDSYSILTEGTSGYLASDGEMRMKKSTPKNMTEVYDQIKAAIEIEENYQADLRRQLEEAKKAAAEAERRRKEEEALEAARQAELERIRAEKEEQERRVQEMLERKRAEQEAERKEREKMEAQRLALLEEKRKQKEEEAKRLEEERLRKEAEEKERLERERIEEENRKVRSELGMAAGLSEDELAEPAAEEPPQPEEIEDPRVVAEREKALQQKREKERMETERAQRLKAERKIFESKPFEVIRKEYSRNPLRMLLRLIRHILAVVFGIIPEDTDNPDYKKLRAERLAKKEQERIEKEEREKMEVYYKKYAGTFKYRFRRSIEDRKFKRKRMKEMRGKPKPVYNPPKRTPEQTEEIQREMQRLYREYHVTPIERVTRWFKRMAQERRARKEEDARLAAHAAALNAKARENQPENQQETEAKQEKPLVRRIINGSIITVILAALVFSVYVTACTVRGKPVVVFGRCILRVMTGSMEPSLHVGDCIIVKDTPPEELEVGDIISFYSDQADIQGMLVTHRIVTVCEDGSFITRGDANPVDDSVPVQAEKIVGRYVKKAAFFRWMGSFTDSRKLILLFVMIPLSFVSLFELRSLLKLGSKVEEEMKEARQEEYEARMREAIEAEKKRLAEADSQQRDDGVMKE